MRKLLVSCLLFVVSCSAVSAAEKTNVYSVSVDPPPQTATDFYVDLAGQGSVKASLKYIRLVNSVPTSTDDPCAGGPNLNFRAICELNEGGTAPVVVRAVLLEHTTNANAPYYTPARASGYLKGDGSEVTRYPKTLGINVKDGNATLGTSGEVSLFHSDSGNTANTIVTELKYSLSDVPVSRDIDYIAYKYLIPKLVPPVSVPPNNSIIFDIPGLYENKYLTLSFLIEDPGAPSPHLRKGVFFQTPAPLPILGAMFGFRFSRKIRHRIKSAAI
jgi:hypothetical protein